MQNALVHMPPYPWQSACWQQFVAMHNAEKLPHAILLHGTKGLGIGSLARAMSQYLLCDEPRQGQACGKCKSCLLVKAGSHPDQKIVIPDEKSEQLKVDQIREINNFVAQTSQQGAYKVVVLEPAHTMNASAANALLKNLEEPAGRTVFILVSDQPQRLLPTIRSRCRSLQIVSPSRSEAENWLTNQGVKGPEKLLDYLGNVPLIAQDWFTSGELEEREVIVQGLLDLLKQKKSAGDLVKLWSKYDALTVLDAVQVWLEHAIRRKSTSVDSTRQLMLLHRLGDRLRQKRAQLQATTNINTGLVLEEVSFDLRALGKISHFIDFG